MSHWGENPEQYNAIICNGIVDYIDKEMAKGGFEVPGDWLEGYTAMVEVLQNAPHLRSIYDTFVSLARVEIDHGEREYFSELVDDIKQQVLNSGEHL